MNRLSLGFIAALAIPTVLGACGPKEIASKCSLDPAPVECSAPCDPLPGAANTCPSGWHCSEGGTCDSQCAPGSDECGDGYACTADGRCVDDGNVDPPPIDMACPAVTFTPMPKTPSIILVLDRSGSMSGTDISPTRYKAMRSALVDTTTGIVTQLESKAYFGSELYWASSGQTLNTAIVPRALNNAAAIRTSLQDNSPGGNTPTYSALDKAVADFGATPPPADSPPVIVLATDGLPTDDNGEGSTSAKNASVTAAANAYAAGIPVYVLAINQNDQHFQDLANAGQGWQSGDPDVQYYPVGNAADLQTAFQTIINGVISCDLSLTSAIDDGQAMNGTLTINGVTQTYGTDWVLVGGNTIRVQGAACTMLKSTQNPNVQATFPCGSIIL
jgi:hypothetical protein